MFLQKNGFYKVQGKGNAGYSGIWSPFHPDKTDIDQ